MAANGSNGDVELPSGSPSVRRRASRRRGTPLFAQLAATPVQFEGPVAVVEGTGVMHLRYRVEK